MVVLASFEDFLYIILGLAWVIYSAYNAKKKQKAKNNPASAGKNKSFLDSIISEIGLPTEQPKPVDAKLEQDDEYHFDEDEPEIMPTHESQKLFSYDDEYEESNYTPPFNVVETETVVVSTKVGSTNVEIAKELKEDVYTIKKKKSRKRIDLRRAVIYSVILKKVHF